MHKESHSGIYLLPNFLTTASLFAAFYSIVSSMNYLYEKAVIAIFIGMLADGLDGRIARLTNTQSEFGAEYDSLSDMVTFGVATSLLLYSFHLQHLGKIGWLVAFVFTASVALRLARFNTQAETADKKFFQGLACPAAAGFLVSFVWLCQQYELNNDLINWSVVALTIITACLMVSNIRFYSFKTVDIHGRVPFLYILILVILFVAIAASPAKVLFIGLLIYVFSGPVQTLYHVYKIRKQRKRRKKKND